MIKSMTGYGYSKNLSENFSIEIEIKSLNSKNLDISFYTPKILSYKEIEWKNKITKLLRRGKVSVYITLQHNEKNLSLPFKVSEENFKYNYDYLKKLSVLVKCEPDNLFELAIKNTINASKQNLELELSNEQINIIDRVINEAIDKCDQTRIEEGKSIYTTFQGYIKNINDCVKEIDLIKQDRINVIQNNLRDKVLALTNKNINFDSNRFEQELIYYIERLDIEEEITRLKKHLIYFVEVLNDTYSHGKKLIFILQEINREINTLGAKANNSDIQKKVILMKEETEKIKEQLQNIL